jgi:hypothetical protein
VDRGGNDANAGGPGGDLDSIPASSPQSQSDLFRGERESDGIRLRVVIEEIFIGEVISARVKSPGSDSLDSFAPQNEQVERIGTVQELKIQLKKGNPRPGDFG